MPASSRRPKEPASRRDARAEQAEAHNNLGTALQALARLDEAGAATNGRLSSTQRWPTLISRARPGGCGTGTWPAGLPSTNGAGSARRLPITASPSRAWDGSPLAGRTILLWAEQGLGDTLQFVRYAENVRKTADRVILICQPPLVTILSGVAGIDQVVPMGQQPPRFDVHAAAVEPAASAQAGRARILSRGPTCTPTPC